MAAVAPTPSSNESAHAARPRRRWIDGAKDLAILAKDAGVRWSDDGCYRYAASLAYAALFSIFPLLLLCVTGLGYFLGSGDEVRHKVIASLDGVTSPPMRQLLDETLESLQTHSTARGIGAVVGVVTLVIGASGVFSELQAALNAIWRVKVPPAASVWGSVVQAIRSKALAFGTVLVAAAVLFASLVVSAILSAAQTVTAGAGGAMAWPLVDAGLSAGLLGVLLAAIYRIVPQTPVAWRDVAGAAFTTALLFTALKGALTWYLGHFSNYAAYGAVGAVLGSLTWIYIAGMVILWGAELSRLVAERYGSLSQRRAR